MRYALIGCGRISKNHIKAAVENSLEIVALCDLSTEKISSLLDNTEVKNPDQIKRYTDYKQMIKENELDLISIATESGSHAEIAVFCIEHNINIIIEKPIALSLADADTIIALSQKKGVWVCACHQNRFNRAVQELRHALESERFGKLSHGSVHVRWNRSKEYYTQAPWRGTWKQDGGALMNQCIHGIDLLRWMMGDEIETVYGVSRKQFHDYLEVEDVGMAVIQFKNGAIGTIEGTTNVYPKNMEETLYLFGEKGTVKLGGRSVNAIDVWDFQDNKDADIEKENLVETTANVYGNGHTALYADMIEAINMKRPPYVDAKAGRNALELVLAIYKSQKEGLPVSFPVKDFSTTDMLGVF